MYVQSFNLVVTRKLYTSHSMLSYLAAVPSSMESETHFGGGMMLSYMTTSSW